MPTLSVTNGASWEALKEVLKAEETPGLPLVFQKPPYAGSITLFWDHQIAQLLREVHEWIRLSHRERMAWPTVEGIIYETEFVSPAALARIAAVREQPYATAETWVIYSENEIREFF